MCNRLVYRGFDGGPVKDIHVQRQSLPTGGFDRRAGRVESTRHHDAVIALKATVTINESTGRGGQVVAGMRQRQGDGLAETTAGPSNQGNRPRLSSRVSHQMWLRSPGGI